MNLTKNQMTVLSILTQGDAYGLEIVDKAKESGVSLLLGSFYNIARKLENEGLVESRMGETTAERGGNRRKYYSITAKGQRALKEAQLELARLWKWTDFIPKLNLDLNFVFKTAVILFVLLFGFQMESYAGILEGLKDSLNDISIIYYSFIKAFTGNISVGIMVILCLTFSLILILYIMNLLFKLIHNSISYLLLNEQQPTNKFEKILKYYECLLPKKIGGQEREEVIGDLMELYIMKKQEGINRIWLGFSMGFQMTYIFLYMLFSIVRSTQKTML